MIGLDCTYVDKFDQRSETKAQRYIPHSLFECGFLARIQKYIFLRSIKSSCTDFDWRDAFAQRDILVHSSHSRNTVLYNTYVCRKQRVVYGEWRQLAAALAKAISRPTMIYNTYILAYAMETLFVKKRPDMR